MKTTLDLPDELVREVKLRAVHQRRTVKDLVAEYIRQGLGLAPGGEATQRPASPRVKIGDGGLPVIPCAPDAPASRMRAEDLLALEKQTLAEEDSKRAGLPL